MAFWPHERNTARAGAHPGCDVCACPPGVCQSERAPELKADINTDAARQLREEFERLNRSAMSEPRKLVAGQPRPAREVIDGKPIWFWSFDQSNSADVAVCAEYRDGRLSAIRRYPQSSAPKVSA